MKTYRIEYSTLGGANFFKKKVKIKKEYIEDYNFKEAIDLWFSNKDEAIKKYGHISDWILIGVNDMSYTFHNRENFNEDISKWNTNRVKNMEGMFKGAKKFNQPIGEWETRQVTNMESMFEGAEAFNKTINTKPKVDVTELEGGSVIKEKDWNTSWDVSNVTNMKNMFKGAKQFNQSINNWDTSKVTDMESMFEEAKKFNQPVNHWNVKEVTNMKNMFKNAINFTQDIDTKYIIKFFQLTNQFKTRINEFTRNLDVKTLYVIYDYYASWRPEKVENFENMFEGANSFKKIPNYWLIKKKDIILPKILNHLTDNSTRESINTYYNTIMKIENYFNRFEKYSIHGEISYQKKNIINETESLVRYEYNSENGREILAKNWPSLQVYLKDTLKMGENYKDNIIFIKDNKVFYHFRVYDLKDVVF